METMIKAAGLADIYEKVHAEERLSLTDGVRLYECQDLLALGYLANMVRERKNGDDAFFIYNQHINYSNICTNLCKFCAFGKEASSNLPVSNNAQPCFEAPIADPSRNVVTTTKTTSTIVRHLRAS